MQLSVILGSLNRRPFLKKAIDSIRAETDAESTEIIVVDGGSTDGTLKWLAKQKDIVTIIQHNSGTFNGKPIPKQSWGYFINLAFKCCRGKYICMLSDDCLIIPGAIKNAIEEFDTALAKNEKLGGLAFWWRNWPNQTKYSVQYHYNQLNINHGLFLKSALREVGYADESTYKFYSGDVDLCFKLKHAGYEIREATNAYIEHYWHANFGQRKNNWQTIKTDNDAFTQKWSGIYPEIQAEGVRRMRLEERDYTDATKTYRQFLRLHILNPGYYRARIEKRLKQWKK